ncbi:hypothetical protein LLE87_27985, partial [Paenibacillus polymyxa]|nr:hypothetical protein [Paenibacillus polymyxa]
GAGCDCAIAHKGAKAARTAAKPAFGRMQSAWARGRGVRVLQITASPGCSLLFARDGVICCDETGTHAREKASGAA